MDVSLRGVVLIITPHMYSFNMPIDIAMAKSVLYIPRTGPESQVFELLLRH